MKHANMLTAYTPNYDDAEELHNVMNPHKVQSEYRVSLNFVLYIFCIAVRGNWRSETKQHKVTD